jgi:hypothetical protein
VRKSFGFADAARLIGARLGKEWRGNCGRVKEIASRLMTGFLEGKASLIEFSVLADQGTFPPGEGRTVPTAARG